MGLLLDLPKEKNTMYYDFDNAYWVIENLSYDTTACGFELNAYPTREAHQMENTILKNNSIGFGSCGSNVVNGLLYAWNVELAIIDVFPTGIPLSPDEQKTAIYEWIKNYTKLPFIDVIEE